MRTSVDTQFVASTCAVSEPAGLFSPNCGGRCVRILSLSNEMYPFLIKTQQTLTHSARIPAKVNVAASTGDVFSKTSFVRPIEQLDPVIPGKQPFKHSPVLRSQIVSTHPLLHGLSHSSP